jgi:hypothetical protein
MDERERYRITFHVATLGMNGHAAYEVRADSEEDAVSEARRLAGRDHVPTYGARVETEVLT